MADKEKSLREFAAGINYQFQNLKLLERALTHRSWAHERIAPGREETVRQQHNE